MSDLHAYIFLSAELLSLHMHSKEMKEHVYQEGTAHINNQFESSLAAQWPYYYYVSSSSLFFGIYTSEHRALTASGDKNPQFSPYSGETSRVLFMADSIKQFSMQKNFNSSKSFYYSYKMIFDRQDVIWHQECGLELHLWASTAGASSQPNSTWVVTEVLSHAHPKENSRLLSSLLIRSQKLRKAGRQAGKQGSGRQIGLLCLKVTKIPTLHRTHQRQRCLRCLQLIVKGRNVKPFL